MNWTKALIAWDRFEAVRPWLDFAAGHWTREPAEVDGLYFEKYDPAPYPDLVYLKVGQRPPGQTSHRWSVPLPELPPVPECHASGEGLPECHEKGE